MGCTVLVRLQLEASGVYLQATQTTRHWLLMKVQMLSDELEWCTLQ